MDAALEAPAGLFEHKAYTKRGNTKAIEFCGELKVRGRQQLDAGHVAGATLRCAGVASLGTVDAVAARRLAALTVLDLQCNLLPSWAAVAAIVDAAPALTAIDVSGNRLAPGGASDFAPLKRLSKIRASGVGLGSWADVLLLASPNLEELHVAANPVGSDVSGGDLAAAFPRLALLDVAKTGLADAAPLAALPALDELHASENPGLAGLGAVFPGITTLAVAGCGFTTWATVDALNGTAPSLRRLRFGRDNEIVAPLAASEARALLVARLPTIVHINGASVSRKERTEAEKRYVRVAAARVAAETDAAEDHPRLEALSELHGAPDAARGYGADTGGSGLRSGLVEITLVSMAADSCSVEPLTKKFPGAAKISLLKRLAAKRFDMQPGAMVLYFSLDAGDAPSILDDDEATLAQFGVPNGATVRVNDKVDSDTE